MVSIHDYLHGTSLTLNDNLMPIHDSYVLVELLFCVKALPLRSVDRNLALLFPGNTHILLVLEASCYEV